MLVAVFLGSEDKETTECKHKRKIGKPFPKPPAASATPTA